MLARRFTSHRAHPRPLGRAGPFEHPWVAHMVPRRARDPADLGKGNANIASGEAHFKGAGLETICATCSRRLRSIVLDEKSTEGISD